MTKNETLQILNILKIAYPTFYKSISKQEALDIVDLWSNMFEEDDVLLVIAAVKSFIATDDKDILPLLE